MNPEKSRALQDMPFTPELNSALGESIADYVHRLPLPLARVEQEVELAQLREAGAAAEILQGLLSSEDRLATYHYIRTAQETKYKAISDVAQRKGLEHHAVAGWLSSSPAILQSKNRDYLRKKNFRCLQKWAKVHLRCSGNQICALQLV